MSASVARALGKNMFLVPSFAGSFDRDMNSRIQGPLSGEDIVTDSLSPVFGRNIVELSPGLELKMNRKHLQWSLGLKASKLWLDPSLNNEILFSQQYQYLLPWLSWQKDIGTGKRISARYSTDVNAPSAIQLLPVKDYRNPLLRTTGNPDLKPEYVHSIDLNYNNFDQFTMSSFYIFLNGRYTVNKIDWNRVVQPDLSQDLQTFNTPYALQASMNTVEQIGECGEWGKQY
jgi:hypothetical protein